MAPKRGKTYRTANGKQIDFGALLLAHEKAPALGNMNVNARGDLIDAEGNITKSREDLMREYNQLNTMVPQDGEVPEGTNVAQADEDDWEDWTPTVPEKPAEQPASTHSTGGLAAAIKKAENTEK